MNAQLLDALKVLMLAMPTGCAEMKITGYDKTVGEICREASALELREEWQDANVSLPDDDVTVLIALDDGEVWTGFMDAGEWRYVSGDEMAAKVTHWQHLPAGPAKAAS